LNILFTHHRYHSNLRGWFKGFQENGNDVRLLVYKQDKIDDAGLPRSVYLSPSRWSRKLMAKNTRMRGDGVDSFSPFYFPSFKSLWNYVKSFEPQVVVIRPVFTRFGLILTFICIIKRIKIVYHSRNKIYRHYPKLKLRLFNLVMFFCNAHWMTPVKGDNRRFSLPSRRFIYMPFAIKPKYESRRYFYNGHVNILCVAKYFKSKNPQMALDVFLNLREQNENIKLTICGTGDETGDYFRSMVNQCEHSDYKSDITLLINQPERILDQLYSSHDIFILTTNHDPASFTVLEAMSYGLATLTTDVDGASGYIKDGKNGFVFGKGNANELMQKITLLLNAQDEIESFGNCSLELINKYHSGKINTKRLLQILNG